MLIKSTTMVLLMTLRRASTLARTEGTPTGGKTTHGATRDGAPRVRIGDVSCDVFPAEEPANVPSTLFYEIPLCSPFVSANNRHVVQLAETSPGACELRNEAKVIS